MWMLASWLAVASVLGAPSPAIGVPANLPLVPNIATQGTPSPPPASPELRRRQGALVETAKQLLALHGEDLDAREEARSLLEKVLAIDPQHSNAHVELARYYIKSGYWNGKPYSESTLDHADDVLRSALSFNPVDAETYALLGVLRLDQDRDEEWLAALRKADDELRLALRSNPRNAEAYVLLGVLRLDQDRYEESLAALRKAEALGTDNPWLHADRAVTYEKLGRWDDAARSLHKLDHRRDRSRWPQNFKAALPGIWLYLQHHDGDVRGAERTYRHAPAWLGFGSRDDHALFLLGPKNDPDGAIAETNKAIALYPKARWFRRTLALAQYVKWDQLRKTNPVKAKTYRAAAEAGMPNHGEVFVHATIWLGRSAVLQHLVLALHAEGWSLDSVGSTGITPLICSIECATPSVRWLLEHGANPNVASRNGATPLVIAMFGNDMQSVDLLLAHGADVDAVGQYHRSLLYQAVDAGKFAMVRKLLAHKAKIDLPASAHETPLMLAAGEGSQSMVQLLLDAGADKSLTIPVNQTAADLAELNHHPEVAAMIRSYSAKTTGK